MLIVYGIEILNGLKTARRNNGTNSLALPPSPPFWPSVLLIIIPVTGVQRVIIGDIFYQQVAHNYMKYIMYGTCEELSPVRARFSFIFSPSLSLSVSRENRVISRRRNHRRSSSRKEDMDGFLNIIAPLNLLVEFSTHHPIYPLVCSGKN